MVMSSRCSIHGEKYDAKCTECLDAFECYLKYAKSTTTNTTGKTPNLFKQRTNVIKQSIRDMKYPRFFFVVGLLALTFNLLSPLEWYDYILLPSATLALTMSSYALWYKRKQQRATKEPNYDYDDY